MKKATSNPLTPEQESELKTLAELPDAQINTASLPEQKDWSGARRGVFAVPSKGS